MFYIIIKNLLDLIVEKYSSKVIQKIVDLIGNVKKLNFLFKLLFEIYLKFYRKT